MALLLVRLRVWLRACRDIVLSQNGPTTAIPLLSAVLGRIKFWSQKPRIIELEVRIIEV